ncbi:unnamed protein product [Didymodactylos carnosus]|uniref:Secreted protein n=1 Tax=Didymodactylos carnosus TaxID=1234261 RepID=A0A813SJS6_9BILA|nr:unnamed protein product [Didymodactylos carnosus]CAF0846428.1 unnamed protein product [Didymodactylos carnosus]CAF3582867.1 unnamed protein product [Didymodactylos carnosus]CAF3631597.1 unnamed protein product [Didymodactylos carnosus]
MKYLVAFLLIGLLLCSTILAQPADGSNTSSDDNDSGDLSSGGDGSDDSSDTSGSDSINVDEPVDTGIDVESELAGDGGSDGD